MGAGPGPPLCFRYGGTSLSLSITALWALSLLPVLSTDLKMCTTKSHCSQKLLVLECIDVTWEDGMS